MNVAWTYTVEPSALAQLKGFHDGYAPYEESGVSLVTANKSPIIPDPDHIPADVNFNIGQSWLLAKPSSHGATEFSASDLITVIRLLQQNGQTNEIANIKAWHHSHPMDMDSFSGQDIHTSQDRWGKEPWRLAVLYYSGPKPGVKVRYHQWEPEYSVEWEPKPMSINMEDSEMKAAYEVAFNQASSRRMTAEKEELAKLQEWRKGADKWLQQRMPLGLPMSRKKKGKVKLWQQADLSRHNMQRFLAFAYGAECHRVVGKPCHLYACPFNVRSEYEPGRSTVRCAFGMKTVRLPIALKTWQELLANWDEHLDDKDAYYARADPEEPWSPDFNGDTI